RVHRLRSERAEDLAHLRGLSTILHRHDHDAAPLAKRITVDVELVHGQAVRQGRVELTADRAPRHGAEHTERNRSGGDDGTAAGRGDGGRGKSARGAGGAADHAAERLADPRLFGFARRDASERRLGGWWRKNTDATIRDLNLSERLDDDLRLRALAHD